MNRNTRFKPGVSGNETAKWKPGQSGNPAGKSMLRVQFEEAFNEAVITQGGPEEAAELLRKAVRAGEPWAIQELSILEFLLECPNRALPRSAVPLSA